MSGNFWETNLSDEEDKITQPPKSKQEPSQALNIPKIDITLDDFPVSNWDSDNDARHIVDWYNNNRMAVDEKSLSFFKQASGVDAIHTANRRKNYLTLLFKH